MHHTPIHPLCSTYILRNLYVRKARAYLWYTDIAYSTRYFTTMSIVTTLFIGFHIKVLFSMHTWNHHDCIRATHTHIHTIVWCTHFTTQYNPFTIHNTTHTPSHYFENILNGYITWKQLLNISVLKSVIPFSVHRHYAHECT